MPTPDPRSAVQVEGEWPTLLAFLARQRAQVVARVADLPDDLARRAVVPSGTSAMGLVKHLRWVEHGWVDQLVAQRAGSNVRSHDRAGEFTPQPDETLDGLLADYRAQGARSDEVLAVVAPGDAVHHDLQGMLTMRWIVAHLVEETARHAGHLDIVVEQLTGRTG